MKTKSNLHATVPYKFSFSIPDGFILVQDTREQKPLFVRPPKGLVVVTDTLKHGDYSVRGFESTIGIERKGVSDLLTYIGKERKRTIRKLEMLRDLEFAGLVIESPEKTLYESLYPYSQIKPEHIRGFISSAEVKYGIHVYYSSSRTDIARWVLDRLIKYYKYKRDGIVIG